MQHLLPAALLLLAGTAPARAQIQYLNLSEEKLELPTRTFYIGQVLDGRINRAGVGQREAEKPFDLGSYTQALDIGSSLVVGLTRFLRAQLPARPTDQSVLLLRELRVAERTAAGMIMPTGVGGVSLGVGMGPTVVARQARGTLDLYLRTPVGYLFIKTTTDTLRGPSQYAGPSHERNLATVLQHCLAQYSAADLLAAERQPAQTLAGLARTGRPAQPWELTISYPQPGSPPGTRLLSRFSGFPQQ